MVCILGAAGAALLPACGSDTDTGTGGGAGAPSGAGAPATAGAAGTGTAGAGTAGAGTGLTGDATKGQAVYSNPDVAACDTCHGPMGQGLAAAGPNISGSMTAGIGAWSQAEFLNVIRTGTKKDGTKVCALMLQFTAAEIPDQSVADIYAWLKTVPNETPQRGSYCP